MPFWATTTMYRESVTFEDRGDRTSDATLLFHPRAILEMASVARNVIYEDGRDYTIDSAGGRILRLPDSRIPMLPGDRAGAGGALLHPWQSAITYVHDGCWAGYRAVYAGKTLPRVTGRLQRREQLTIVVMGDSISEGYDASGFHSFAPMQPPYASLVAAGLEQRFASRIELHNIAVAGSSASDGAWEAARLAELNPNLVILAYGMNDATYADAREFERDIAAIIGGVRTDSADAEFILIAPMRPTAGCDFVPATRISEYRDVLAGLSGDGIALADMTTLWTDLQQRKTAIDLSGNGLNHPNDFGHRLYAQVILAMVAPVTDVIRES